MNPRTLVPRMVMLIGIPMIVLGSSKYHASQIAVPTYDFSGSFRLSWALMYMVLIAVIAYAFGLPDGVGRNGISESIATAVTAAIAASVVQAFVGDALLPRFVVFGSALLCVVWLSFTAWLGSAVNNRVRQRDRVVLISATIPTEQFKSELEYDRERSAELVEVVSPEDLIGVASKDSKLAVAIGNGANLAVFDRRSLEGNDLLRHVNYLNDHGTRVFSAVDFYDEWIGKIPLAELERYSMYLSLGRANRSSYVRVRRLIDLVVATLLLVPLAVVTPCIWIANRVTSPGPLFFSQDRIGKGEQVFKLHKFRSMTPQDPHQSGDGKGAWTAVGDARITPIGRFLRASHLDELPQAINILRGELAVVGPRPEQPHYVEQLKRDIPLYHLRHAVVPGLTGWAQVKAGYAATVDDTLVKLQYEFWYLNHQGIKTDVRIIFRTLRQVFGGGGR